MAELGTLKPRPQKASTLSADSISPWPIGATSDLPGIICLTSAVTVPELGSGELRAMLPPRSGQQPRVQPNEKPTLLPATGGPLGLDSAVRCCADQLHLTCVGNAQCRGDLVLMVSPGPRVLHSSRFC